MSIRPADMQIVVQKAQEIHPAKQSVVNKQDNELLQAQQHNKEVVNRESKRVQTTEKANLSKIKEDEKNKGNKKNKKRKNKDDDEDEDLKKKSLASPVGSHFDMKI